MVVMYEKLQLWHMQKCLKEESNAIDKQNAKHSHFTTQLFLYENHKNFLPEEQHLYANNEKCSLNLHGHDFFSETGTLQTPRKRKCKIA